MVVNQNLPKKDENLPYHTEIRRMYNPDTKETFYARVTTFLPLPMLNFGEEK